MLADAVRHWTTGYPVVPPEKVRGYVPVVFPVTVMTPVPLLTAPEEEMYPWIRAVEVAPTAPVWPVGPVTVEAAPTAPGWPVGPVTVEAAPTAPGLPVGPVTVEAAPTAPGWPVGPVGPVVEYCPLGP